MDWKILCFVFSHVWFVFFPRLAHLVLFPVPAEALSPNPTSHSIRRSSEGKTTSNCWEIGETQRWVNLHRFECFPGWHLSSDVTSCHTSRPFSHPAAPPAGSLVEDIGEMILQLRRQVENLFSSKFGTLACRGTARPSIRKRRHLLFAHLPAKRQSTVKISSDDWKLM